MDADKRRQLRDAFGAFMTGVTIVTSVDKQGSRLASPPIRFRRCRWIRRCCW